MRQQVVSAAVDGFLRYDMISLLRQRLNGIGDGGRSGGGGQRRDAALQRGDPGFKDVLRGVCQSAVYVSGVGKAEAGGGMRGVLEYIGGGLIDRNSSGVGSGVGVLLTRVKLNGLEFIMIIVCIAHGNYLFLFQ